VSDAKGEQQDIFFTLKLEAVLSKEQLEPLGEMLIQAGLSHFLQSYPMSYLRIQNTVDLHGSPVNGVYDFEEGGAEIALERDGDEYGQVFQWGYTSKISATGITPFEAVCRTLVHEIGHHLHRTLRLADPSRFVQSLQAPRQNAASAYGKTDRLEYFAETFSAYVFYPTELIFYDESGYKMMKSVLDSLGIQGVEYDSNRKSDHKNG
jgi:hypothetical protein